LSFTITQETAVFTDELQPHAMRDKTAQEISDLVHFVFMNIFSASGFKSLLSGRFKYCVSEMKVNYEQNFRYSQLQKYVVTFLNLILHHFIPLVTFKQCDSVSFFFVMVKSFLS